MTETWLHARAHAEGNRIDLRWSLPDEAGYDGARLVRAAGLFPLYPDEGEVIAEGALDSAIDHGLAAERMYYYSLFPYRGDPPVYDTRARQNATAVATADKGLTGHMWQLLPAIYHRYDRADQFLARFLSLPGGELNRLYSMAGFTRHLQDVRETPGRLLPLLAHWIGWETDFKRDLTEQRNELRRAPAVYRRIGLITTVEATVKRLSGRDSRTKEYLHNVFASNRPPRYNLWSKVRADDGTWSEEESLLSLDYAYDGGADSVLDAQGMRWLVYHTERKGRWQIWYKATAGVSLPLRLAARLADGAIDLELQRALVNAGANLSQTASLTRLSDHLWDIDDDGNHFVLRLELRRIFVCRVDDQGRELAASRPLVSRETLAKYPSLAREQDRLWLFWSSLEPSAGHWQVHYRYQEDARWSPVGPRSADADNPFVEGGSYDPSRPRRHARAVSDGDGRLWLFWQERRDGAWRLRYNRRDGGVWGEAVTADSELDDVEDVQLLIPPADPERRLLVLAARRLSHGPDQERWEVIARRKGDWELDSGNWGDLWPLPKADDPDHHDREPRAAVVDGAIEVYWSSDREGRNWSLWRARLEETPADQWQDLAAVTSGPHAQRAPLPLVVDGGLWLIFRGNRALVYRSDSYRATETVDRRYTGTTSLCQRNTEALALRNSYRDGIGYTHDTGIDGRRDDRHRIGRDTLGVFLDGTHEPAGLADDIGRLRAAMGPFMPMTDRLVFLIEGVGEDGEETLLADALVEGEDFSSDLEFP